mmetsp:Transcript_44386/g.125528  ORF Transcript_44386/g.125528 Transcript_44386/m.125528 type:complete len:108 (+) Transcript_44386:1208-1531(+)
MRTVWLDSCAATHDRDANSQSRNVPTSLSSRRALVHDLSLHLSAALSSSSRALTIVATTVTISSIDRHIIHFSQISRLSSLLCLVLPLLRHDNSDPDTEAVLAECSF